MGYRFVLSRNFWKENQVWGGDLAVPPFLSGVAWAAIASTVLALCFLLFDFVFLVPASEMTEQIKLIECRGMRGRDCRNKFPRSTKRSI